MYFVITGQTNKGQENIKKIIRSKGHHVGDHVNQNTDYLIANYPSFTTKYKNALLFNIPIITEEELFKLIEER